MVADTAADMEVDKAEEKKLFLAEMLLHMMANKVADMVAEMAADKKNIYFYFVLG